MTHKTMKQVLTKKVNEWLEHIDDAEVRAVIEENLVITGGCFTSFISREKPNDYDCYFRTKAAAATVAQYYINAWNAAHPAQTNKLGKACGVMLADGDNLSQEVLDYFQVSRPEDSKAVMISNIEPGRLKIIFPSDGVVGNPDDVRAPEELGTAVENVTEVDEVAAGEVIEQERKRYFPVFISSNAITLSDGIQLIVRFYGEPDSIHDTFDFEHTKAYWMPGHPVVIPNSVYECVTNKVLRYTGSKYPVCSLFRLRKFIARGWHINAGQILKMAMQVSELDLSDINTLEDQLIGVDSLYFMELIHQFRRQKAGDPDFALTSAYIVSIIDKIF